jgi:hypothetical protein
MVVICLFYCICYFYSWLVHWWQRKEIDDLVDQLVGSGAGTPALTITTPGETVVSGGVVEAAAAVLSAQTDKYILSFNAILLSIISLIVIFHVCLLFSLSCIIIHSVDCYFSLISLSCIIAFNGLLC